MKTLYISRPFDTQGVILSFTAPGGLDSGQHPPQEATVSLSTGESLWTYEEGDGDRLWESTLGDLLRAGAAEHPDRIALVDADPDPAQRRSWTYAELLAAAERVARALLVRFHP